LDVFLAMSLLVIGTTNDHKAQELTRLLAPCGFQTKTLSNFSDALDVRETGDSFAANAQLKAGQQAKHLGLWVLADDSGLEVDALDGRPGIYSARYAGPNATDAENNAKLLEELNGIPDAKRTARYYCHVSVADPQGTIRAESKGICRGRIRESESGTNGFGYDPLFEVVEYHRTFGELGSHVKAIGRAPCVPSFRSL